MKTPLAEGQRIHYNFAKPTRLWDGRPPVQLAEIGIKGKDKWMELLRHSIIPKWFF